VSLIFAAEIAWYVLYTLNLVSTTDRYRFFEIGMLASSAIAVLLIIGGLLTYGNPVRKLNWFKWSTRVSLFLVCFFLFYHEQLMAFLGVVFHVAVLYALNVIVTTETNKKPSA
jgi:hypothetical protein